MPCFFIFLWELSMLFPLMECHPLSFPPLILQVQVKYSFFLSLVTHSPKENYQYLLLLGAPIACCSCFDDSIFRLDSNYLCVYFPWFQLHWDIFEEWHHFFHLCISTFDKHKMLIHCLVNKQVEKKILVAVIRNCSQVYLLETQVIPRLVLGAEGVLLQARWAFWVCYHVCLKGIWQVLKTACLKVKFTFVVNAQAPQKKVFSLASALWLFSSFGQLRFTGGQVFSCGHHTSTHQSTLVLREMVGSSWSQSLWLVWGW